MMEHHRDVEKQALDEKQHEARQPAVTEGDRNDAKVDLSIDESFPASDPPGWADQQAEKEQQAISKAARIEAKIDRDIDDSFPASDPPGWTMGIKKRRKKVD